MIEYFCLTLLSHFLCANKVYVKIVGDKALFFLLSQLGLDILTVHNECMSVVIITQTLHYLDDFEILVLEGLLEYSDQLQIGAEALLVLLFLGGCWPSGIPGRLLKERLS